MTPIEIHDDVSVLLVRASGDDNSVAQAARVSVVGANSLSDDAKDAGLIGYLMRKKHGSPFEHNSMSFYVKAPIFVFREFHRHRVGWSYNEMSGRYTVLPAEFYIPKPDRKLVNAGGSANPRFEPGSDAQVQQVRQALTATYQDAWDAYDELLGAGIANEVARLVLPVGVMSQMYATCNARSLMNFLALRTADERAAYPSNPQHEIELVARKLEAVFAARFPVTYAAFNENGRVAP